MAEKAAPEEDGGESSSESEDEDKLVFSFQFLRLLLKSIPFSKVCR